MQNKSLVKKITSGSITLVICAFIIALTANYWHAMTRAKIAYEKQLTEQLLLLSQSLEGPLWALDEETVKLLGDTYMTGTEAVSLEIFAQHQDGAVYSKRKAIAGKVIYGQQNISHNDAIIGRIHIGLSGVSYAESLSRLLTYSIILGSFIVLSLTQVMRKLFQIHLQTPLRNLEAWTDRLASGDYTSTPPSIELQELSSLADKFTNMAEKIQRRELSLQTSEKKFRGLFENTEVSIWDEDMSAVFAALDDLRAQGITDLRQHLTKHPQLAGKLSNMVKINQVNDATLKLFGAKTQAEMLTQIDQTFGPEAIEVFIDELCAIWERKPGFRAETSYRTLDGKELSAIISFHMPETVDGYRSLPVSIIDITERKKNEQELAKYREQLEVLVEEQTQKLQKAHAELLQRERLTTLGKLTATVSHELRNPLGTIQTALFSIENTLERNNPQQAERSLRLAERSIDRCVNIIEELNCYARVRDLNIAEVSVDDWLQGVVEEQTIPEDVRFELNLACGIRASFDQEKLRQVVVNLINNSVHALLDEFSNGKHLQLSSRLLGNEYEISVRDDGVGMSEVTKEKIFEPLYSTKNFGVGLGMVVVQNIIKQHQGKIRIESQEGQGAVVSLRLPVNPQEIS